MIGRAALSSDGQPSALVPSRVAHSYSASAINTAPSAVAMTTVDARASQRRGSDIGRPIRNIWMGRKGNT